MKSLFLIFLSLFAFVASAQSIDYGNEIIYGTLQLTNYTASTVPYLDSTKTIQSSTVTPTELAFVHNVTSSLCGINQSCTLTNKSMSGASNTFTSIPLSAFTNIGTTTTVLHGNPAGSPTFAQIVDADISSSAAIARSKMATGTINSVVTNDGSGNLSSTTVVGISNGGTNNAALGVVAGSMYYADGSKFISMGAGSAGQVPISAGTTVAWGTSQGGLISDRELIPNTNLEVNSTGYAAYANTPGPLPVTGSGGAPNTTCARTTSSPITGVGSLLITKAGSANRQGEGCAISTVTLSQADTQPTVEQIDLDFKVASGTFTAGSDGSSATDSDYEIFIYDVANNVVIEPFVYKLYSNLTGHFTSWFQTSINATTYRLIAHNATTTTNNFSLEIDNVSIHPAKSTSNGNPGVVARAHTVSGTFSSSAAIVNYDVVDMDSYGAITTGASWQFKCPVSGTYFMTASFTDSSAALATYQTFLTKGGTTFATNWQVREATNAASLTSMASGLIQCNSGELLAAKASGNAGGSFSNVLGDNVISIFLVNANSGNSVPPIVAARAHVGSAVSTTALNPINYDTIDFDTSGAITTGATTWQFKCPTFGFYHVEAYGFFGASGNLLTVYKNGAIDTTPAIAAISNTSGGGGSTIIKCNSGETLDIRPTVTATPTNVGSSPVTLANSNYVSIFLLPPGAGASPAGTIRSNYGSLINHFVGNITTNGVTSCTVNFSSVPGLTTTANGTGDCTLNFPAGNPFCATANYACSGMVLSVASSDTSAVKYISKSSSALRIQLNRITSSPGIAFDGTSDVICDCLQ